MSGQEPDEERQTPAKKPKKASLLDVQAWVNSAKANALDGIAASKLQEQRTSALEYYEGNMERDMPSQEGKSRAVSTDVSDAVEGLMPNLMDIFCGSDEVVRFEPVGPDDEDAAKQETDYVNHVFMQQNNGFMVLYSFIKDALLSKTGLAKVWWDVTEREERETYYDLTQEQFLVLLKDINNSDGKMEIIAHSERPVGSPVDPAAQTTS